MFNPKYDKLTVLSQEPEFKFKLPKVDDKSIVLTLLEDFRILIPSFIDNPMTDENYEETVVCTIHKGTSFNFGTVKWYVRWYISPTDPVLGLSSLVHDALVNEFGDSTVSFSKFVGPNDEEVPIEIDRVSWKLAADAMLEIMKDFIGAHEQRTTFRKRLKFLPRYLKTRLIYSSIRLYGFVKGLK